ncbi:uracil-DNA glycosylase family protein [Paraburkholderia sediminicola]|uniref:Uracil-DNA glycosylase family protein n=1 Tax=Paraburkholderia rhynchosiae TaxID=487049 RepID=A0ACC7NJF0_9BURK
MALHDSVLEEFGLAPLWVRRGMAAHAVEEAGVGQGAVALAGQPGRGDDARAAAAGAGGLTQDIQRPGPRASESRQADAAPTHSERHAPVRDGQAASSAGAGERFEEREAWVRTSEPLRSAQDGERGERRAQPAPGGDVAQERVQAPGDTPESQTPREPMRQSRRVQPSQPEAQEQSAQRQSRVAEPPAFDAPADDDFAWFDDLPAHPPSEARGDPLQLPAIHTLDWDALSERVSACRLCRLCEKRTNTVFGVGDRSADWMLIGEAPGENEDRLGEPFVGQAGKLLDNMLRSLTLARDTNVYIANVIKCRPPGNRNPEPDEVARCEPYLQRQVSLVKPKLIVALGRFAAQSLLKTDASISSLRGRVHEYEGVPVIVTYHPAYLLRSLPDKAKAWADLCLARDTWRAAGGAPSDAAK